MNILHTLFTGFIVSIAWFIIGSLLYTNPTIGKIYKKYENNPGMKKWDKKSKYITYMYLLGALTPSLIMAFVYKLIAPISILHFGLILLGIRIIPRFFDMWIQSSYPNKLLYIEIINGTILSFVAALVLHYI